ncbi:MAG: alcohol dehydrogenase catalytic domain-containing protein [Planctomycetota bacterium]
MRAIVVDGRSLHFDTARPEPHGGARDITVRVRRAGICATDLEILGGYMNFCGVPGHEFVGIAESGKFAGQRVVGEINAACGNCYDCQRARDRHCSKRTVLGILGRDGAFAEKLTLPESNLRAVPASISDDAAVFIEPLAAAFAILEQVHMNIIKGAPAAVLGDGRLGILCALVLANAGAVVTHIGKNENKLAISANAGVRILQIKDRAEISNINTKFSLVVDATGSAHGLLDALSIVEPRGTVVLKTTTREAPPESLAKIVIDEITIIGSRCGRFEPAIAALASGAINPLPLIHAHYPLEAAEEAFSHASRRGTLKVIFEVAGT